jgi:transposase-like protein
MKANDAACPACGNSEAYWLERTQRFKCTRKGCYKQYTATSGTEYHCRKLPLETLTAIDVRFSEGLNIAQVSREFGVDYKTAWRLKQIHDGRPVYKQRRA